MARQAYKIHVVVVASLRARAAVRTLLVPAGTLNFPHLLGWQHAGLVCACALLRPGPGPGVCTESITRATPRHATQRHGPVRLIRSESGAICAILGIRAKIPFRTPR